jgi:tyrosyl-tRNA synthetase
MGVVSLIQRIGLVPSNTEGFRTIEQGGLAVNDVKIEDPKLLITKDSFKDGKLIIKKGKKTFHMVEID